MQTCMHSRVAPRAQMSASTSSKFMTVQTVPHVQTRHNCSQQCRCRRSLSTVARSIEAGVGVFGTKAGMTQIFTPAGLATGGTVIAFDSGNKVTQLRTMEKDGYSAVQVGYQEVLERKIPKPEVGHLKKAGLPAMRHLREFKVRTPSAFGQFRGCHCSKGIMTHLLVQVKDIEGYEVGQQLNVTEMFKEGDLLDIAGKSVGKGFQGELERCCLHGQIRCCIWAVAFICFVSDVSHLGLTVSPRTAD